MSINAYDNDARPAMTDGKSTGTSNKRPIGLHSGGMIISCAERQRHYWAGHRRSSSSHPSAPRSEMSSLV